MASSPRRSLGDFLISLTFLSPYKLISSLSLFLFRPFPPRTLLLTVSLTHWTHRPLLSFFLFAAFLFFCLIQENRPRRVSCRRRPTNHALDSLSTCCQIDFIGRTTPPLLSLDLSNGSFCFIPVFFRSFPVFPIGWRRFFWGDFTAVPGENRLHIPALVLRAAFFSNATEI